MPHFGIAHKDEKQRELTSRFTLQPTLPIDRGPFAIGEETKLRRERFPESGGITPTTTRPEPLGPIRGLDQNILASSVADVARKAPEEIRTANQAIRERIIPSVRERARLAEEAEVFTPSRDSTERGIAGPAQAPILADIDFSSIEGLIKGVGSVAEFTQNLQKFNRSRGITPGGKGKKRGIKPSDIQNRIKFLQSRIDEGFATETEETGIIDELDILNQYMQSVLGVGEARASEVNRQSDLQTILAR